MRDLDNSAADYACLTNDLFSYQKEIEFEGELNNGVLVVQNSSSCDSAQGRPDRQRPDDRADAAVRAHRRHRAARRCSTTSTSTRRPARSSHKYVNELQNWMAGVSSGTARWTATRNSSSPCANCGVPARQADRPRHLGRADRVAVWRADQRRQGQRRRQARRQSVAARIPSLSFSESTSTYVVISKQNGVSNGD